MLPQITETSKMKRVAYFSLLGAWRPCAPACSCVVCHIRACFHVFSLILSVFTSARIPKVEPFESKSYLVEQPMSIYCRNCVEF